MTKILILPPVVVKKIANRVQSEHRDSHLSEIIFIVQFRLRQNIEYLYPLSKGGKNS